MTLSLLEAAGKYAEAVQCLDAARKAESEAHQGFIAAKAAFNVAQEAMYAATQALMDAAVSHMAPEPQ